MTVTIQLPRVRRRRDSNRSGERKPRRRKSQARTGNPSGSGRRKGAAERVFFILFLALPAVTLIQTLLFRAEAHAVTRLAGSEPGETVLAGPGWTFTVPFPVDNKRDIEDLIACESGGQNVSLPDSDGITSDGILQFHRGPDDTMSGSTWEDFSKASGLTGSPRNPTDAIRMADWAISHDLGPRWTCWRNEGLSPGR